MKEKASMEELEDQKEKKQQIIQFIDGIIDVINEKAKETEVTPKSPTV